MLKVNRILIFSKQYSRTYSNNLKSDEIRKIFLNHFIRKEHKVIRSSPVIPLCDPTVAFVNAGMNQFKSIFLGKTAPTYKRAVNSQKCIRVGGKHNDLSIVGNDGYHHTFFEMLGNWSFGDYFKKEACSMALELLRNNYHIDTSRLYFTYFSGDKKLNLPPDTEVYEIWKSLGISEERILPFGCKENFWEMGTTGPCGPCTEIHIDHIPNAGNRANLVNADRPDLTELWNIVFIQFNRNEDGSITDLPEKHVDTGMGFERLCAILQNKTSNYDTDLFVPIFDLIQKETKAPNYQGTFSSNNEKRDYDTAYRILADHSRMITACLSDGMLPDQNQKLRRILRTAFLLSENIFKQENLVTKVIPCVVNILEKTYPEMTQKLNNTLEIISHEQELFKILRINSAKEFQQILNKNNQFDDIDLLDSPGFVPAYKDLQLQKNTFSNNIIPGSYLFKLCDTYGLNEESVKKLAELENLKLDIHGLNEELLKAKQKTKSLIYSRGNEMQKKIEDAISKLTFQCPDTDDSFKYSYEFNNVNQQYTIPPVKSRILGIIQNGQIISDDCLTNNEDIFCLITDKSNFYYESGGQESDKGVIKVTDNYNVIFVVDDVQLINNNTVHVGKFKEANLNIKVGDIAEHFVDSKYRSQNIYHHSATHLLNAAVRSLFSKVTYQVSSSVTFQNLKIELGIIGKKLVRDDLEQIEALIRKIISLGRPIIVTETTAKDVLNRSDITLVPGEIYPETGLRLVTIEDENLQFSSKELCCGTHIRNTKDLKNFCLTNFKQTNRARYAFTAVANNLADEALSLINQYEARVDKFEQELLLEQDKHILVDLELQKLRNKLLHSNIVLPYIAKIDLIEKCNNLLKKIKDSARTTLKEFIEIEMQNVVQQKLKEPFIIHFLDSSTLVESVPLQKATKLCTDRPVMVISLNDGMVKARCCVPTDKINGNFNALFWLKEFASIFKAQVSPPKGQNAMEVCNMKAKRIISPIFEDQLELAIEKATKYAQEAM